MPGGLTNIPRVLHGAFVEYGLSVPPLTVVFQFNPEQLSRNRSLSFDYPGRVELKPEQTGTGQVEIREPRPLRELHQIHTSLDKLRNAQRVTIEEETISFDIRLDATDALNDGNPIAQQFGIAPQLATLERMVQPKGDNLVELMSKLAQGAYNFRKEPPPPLILFIWGRKRVLPVNINSLNITETEFSADLNPIRATAAVGLTVIEGPNPLYTYTRAMTEAMSALHLANLVNVTDVVIPG